MTKFTQLIGTFGFKSDEPVKRGQIVRTLPRLDDKTLPRNLVYIVWEDAIVTVEDSCIDVELCELV